MDESKMRENVTEGSNREIEFIEVECDNARIETSNEGVEQNIESMDLVGDDTAVAETTELQIAIDSIVNESDSINISNAQSLTNPIENSAVDDKNLENESLRGIARFRFKIEKLSEMPYETSLTSPTFKCRKLRFYLLVIRRGVSENGYDRLSVFVRRGIPDGSEVPNDNDFPDESRLEIVVSAEIYLTDELSRKYFAKSFENHLLHAKADWGFDDFISMRRLTQSRLPFFVNDSIMIGVNIKADPPFCYHYNSKEITGHVGLKNQGATCYMNSLLEVLFFLTKFRTACYRIPTELDDQSSMALALQKVFYKLQFSKQAVSTTNLTKSFGWSTQDVLMQHDIQEFLRMLIDKIESRMKNTLLENVVPSMFQGTVESYVKCRDIEFTSQRQEIFYDIQLNMENVNNIYDAFKKYVTPEIMDDDNKYYADNFGLQTAEKGTSFIKLPPVMFLHLLRFQFDGASNMAIKNNNYFEFYDHIDLSDYVNPNESTSTKYTLFAVLAHSGGGSYGHYVAYINPSLDDNWLKFDDEIISVVHPFDAIDENFGINADRDAQQANAYMLVYIRDSDANEILAPVNSKCISDELIISVKTEHTTDENIEWDSHNYASSDVYVVLDTHLESDLRFEFSKLIGLPPPLMPKFNIPNDITAFNFKTMVMEAFKISNYNQLRMWPLHQDLNGITVPFHINDDAKLVSMLSAIRTDRYQYTVWIEIALPGSELEPYDPAKDVLVFYYFYCGSRGRTYYVHHGYHDQISKVADLVPCLNKLMQWSNLELNIYEECGKGKIRELVMTDYLKDGINPRCSTFVMNIVFEPKEHDQSMSTLHSAYLYYEDLRNRFTVTLLNDDDPNGTEVFFFVHRNTTFPQLMDQLANRLNYDREKIQIFINVPSGHYKRAIPSTSTETLSTLFDINQEKLLFYKLHQVNIIDVETKMQFKFKWLSIDMKKTEIFMIYISDDETISSILAEARKLLQPDLADGSGKFRILRVIDNEQLKLVTDPKQIYDYLDLRSNRNYFRIEEIPKGDDTLNENEIFTTVYHFYCPATTQAADPSFIFKLNLEEPWQVVKERIRLRLKLSEAAWQNYRPVIFSSGQELEIEGTKCISDFYPVISTSFVIGLGHEIIKRKN